MWPLPSRFSFLVAMQEVVPVRGVVPGLFPTSLFPFPSTPSFSYSTRPDLCIRRPLPASGLHLSAPSSATGKADTKFFVTAESEMVAGLQAHPLYFFRPPASFRFHLVNKVPQPLVPNSPGPVRTFTLLRAVVKSLANGVSQEGRGPWKGLLCIRGRGHCPSRSHRRRGMA